MGLGYPMSHLRGVTAGVWYIGGYIGDYGGYVGYIGEYIGDYMGYIGGYIRDYRGSSEFRVSGSSSSQDLRVR